MPSLADTYDRFVFDLDGTLWRGPELLPHAATVLGALRERARPVVFMTNSPILSQVDVADKLTRLGVPADAAAVVTVGRVVARHLRERRISTVFALCAAGLVEDLRVGGCDVVEAEAPLEAVGAVVVGRDDRLDFERLTVACALVDSGAALIATNRDARVPVQGGFVPGGGALVAAVEFVTGVTAVALGKPERPMMDEVDRALGAPGTTLVVGDKLSADVLGAHSIGWGSALVLTGATAPGADLDPAPDHVLVDLAGLLLGS